MSRALVSLALAGCAVMLACGGSDLQMVWIEGGAFRLGSDPDEREVGYALSPPAVRSQKWYETWERNPQDVLVAGFWIDRTPVRQSEYLQFVTETEAQAPDILQGDYLAQGFLVHPYEIVEHYRWEGDRPRRALADHPVVLVSQTEASAYCSWRGGRLPTDEEWEAVCRGTGGRVFPWGNHWNPESAHIEANGTASVLAHPSGATPEGVLDLAGNVFEWTSSSFSEDRITLKGCAWDDAPGMCRCAFRHGRLPASRHVLIGFRCAADR